jgi:hypothetical protein
MSVRKIGVCNEWMEIVSQNDSEVKVLPVKQDILSFVVKQYSVEC